MAIQTVNPASGELIKEYPGMSANEVDALIEKTDQAQQQWRATPIQERANVMLKASELLLAKKDEYASIITREMGKPITAARAEIEKCAWVCKHYAENAASYLEPRIIKTEMQKSKVVYNPMGIIFAIMPWNFPFWQVFRFAAPNLMGGNAAILSHAPICTGTGLAIEQLCKEAGFPENLFRTVVVENDVAAHIIAHPLVRGVTLTGSGKAGSIVGSEAAQSLKKVVLELGGSDPYLVLEDADLELAAEACITSRLSNSGQVCISAKRIIVVDKVRDEFEKLMLAKFDRFNMGDPSDESINFGPMARADLRDEVHKQVEESISKGAELVCGGEIPSMNGFYYPPTLLRNVKKGTPAYDEEIFGPVVAILPAKDEAEAIAIANDSIFGLGGAVFTQDLQRGEDIATNHIRTGTCYVNDFVKSDPRLPFGGIKESGYGRELAAEGIHEFMNIKTVCVK